MIFLLSFVFLVQLFLNVQSDPFGRMFERVSVYTPTWKPTVINISEIKTVSGCSVVCLQNQDTCTAFRFSSQNCSLGMAGPTIQLSSLGQSTFVTEIWRDGGIPATPHILLASGYEIVDFSLDPLSSPPIPYASQYYFTYNFGYIDDLNKVNFFGFATYAYGYGNFLLTTNYGQSSFTSKYFSIGHTTGSYTWLGNKAWVIGGTTSEGVDYFENGQFKQGPSFPAGAYPTNLNYPCLTSLDDNTLLIMFGKGSTTVYPDVRSYNLTSGNWSSLRNTTFKRTSTNCERITLANGKSVIFVIGGKGDDGTTLTTTTWMYDIESNTWSLTTYNLPVPLCCGTTVTVKNRLFYFGGTTTSAFAPANKVYEWTEAKGWTLFSSLAGLYTFAGIVAVPYNLA